MMDTKTLVVGQDVYMVSEVYTCAGKVVKVAPEGVEVQATVQSNLTRVGDLLHFDPNGKGRDDEGTHECGPWELVTENFEYTICSDGIHRKIHKIDCACDDRQQHRAIVRRWQEAEALEQMRWRSEDIQQKPQERK
jgi:hypothetical protein